MSSNFSYSYKRLGSVILYTSSTKAEPKGRIWHPGKLVQPNLILGKKKKKKIDTKKGSITFHQNSLTWSHLACLHFKKTSQRFTDLYVHLIDADHFLNDRSFLKALILFDLFDRLNFKTEHDTALYRLHHLLKRKKSGLRRAQKSL